jgi:hypothetical protein
MSSWGGRSFYPRKINNYPQQITNKIAVCAIALNEEPYIEEWIRYNLALGFDMIYIYDNSDTYTLKYLNNDRVKIIHFPGKVKQLEAYNAFIRNNLKTIEWGAFIDIDEFIVLKTHKNIKDLLSDYTAYNCIALNWLMFGTANEKKYINEPVTSRFRYCSNTINEHIKCIAKLKEVFDYNSPHRPLLRTGNVYDTNNNIVLGFFNPLGDNKIACIHHYYTKSEEEFVKKINRGRADIPEKRTLDELDDLHNKNNDNYNSDAWDFYSKHCLSS